MFALKRLLEQAAKICWRGGRRCRGRWPVAPLPPRRCPLNLEALEPRIVPTLLGQQIFPLDNPWNQNIANAPVATNSTAVISNIGTSIRLHPDWGQDSPANGSSPLYGIPVNIVHGNSAAKVNVTIDNYPGESDLIAVPMPSNPVLEGDFQNGPNGAGGGYLTGQRGDSHLIVWDVDNNVSYELFGVTRPTDATLFPDRNGVEQTHTDTSWHAACEAVWDMKTDTFRTLGDTSADAAGLSILAGLARPDEALPTSAGGQGAIDHALRFTLPSSKVEGLFTYPASHKVNSGVASNDLPMGARLRLRNDATVNSLISQMGPEAQTLAHAMQQYGLILSDLGSSMFISGASATNNASNQIQFVWDMNDVFGINKLTAGNFDVVDLAPRVTGLSQTSAAAGTRITVTGQNFSGAAGHLTVFFGNTAVNNVTFVDDSHVSVIVPNGTGTVQVTVQSGVSAPGNPDNANNPIFGYGTSTTSATFTFSQNTANSTTTTGANASAIFNTLAELVTLNATVTNLGNPVNGGTVTFTLFHGGTQIGTAVTGTVSSGAATASYTIPGATAVGSYMIEADYTPSSGPLLASSDNTHTLTISPLGTTTSAVSTSTSGATAMLSALVTGGGIGVNEGTVTFALLDSNNHVVGTPVTSGTVTGGNASVNYAIPAGSVGSYTIRATYNPGVDYTGSSDTSHTLAVNPVVTLNTANLAIDAPSITITGRNFDANPVNDKVTFNDGTVGTVTAATSASLTITFTTSPASTGALTAIVTTDGVSSPSPVQVANIVPAPTVTASSTRVAINATTLTITGNNFEPTAARNSVVLSNGAVGTVTSATSTALTVTFTTNPSATGALTAIVTTDGGSSGAPVQVATIVPKPTVTPTTSTLVFPTVLTIAGTGFDTTAANNSVLLSSGAGVVTAATATSLTVTFTTSPTTLGPLTAVVTTDGGSSGAPVQVATVAAGMIAATPGGPGVSEWNGVSWTQISPNTPVVLASNANGYAVATFAGSGAPTGVWLWNGSTWSQINTSNATALAISNTSTVVADFAGTGVWEYNGSSWSNLNTNDATLLGIGKNGQVVANLSSMGVWLYNGSSWSQIRSTNAIALAIGSDNNEVVASFSTGIYTYAGSAWTQVNGVAVSVLAMGSNGTFVASFPNGVWLCNGSGWTQINGTVARELAISADNAVFAAFPDGVWEDANGWSQLNTHTSTILGNGSVPTMIAATPGGSGVSEWNGVSWAPISAYTPVVLASNANGYAVATFAGSGAPTGVWLWNGSTWSQINTSNASALAISNTNTVVADLAGTGVWEYNGSTWSNLNANDATLLGIGKNGVVVANLSSMGVWLYNGSTWSRINSADAVALGIASDTNEVVASFAGAGIYAYLGGVWTQVNGVTVQVLAVANNGAFVASFPNGVWLYDGHGWTQINGTVARELAIGPNNNALFASFPDGVWEDDAIGWSHLSSVPSTILGTGSVPTVIAATPGGAGVSEWNGLSWTLLSSGLPTGSYTPAALASNTGGYAVATFTGSGAPAGVWFWNGSIWTQINTTNATALALSNTNTVVADFAGTGVWEYNGSSWSNLNANDATLLGIGKSGTVVANLSGTGIWLCNGSTWSRIYSGNALALGIASDNNEVVASIAGSGIFTYSGSAWTQVNGVAVQTLAMGSDGAFVASFSNGVWLYTGSGWTQINGTAARALAISFGNVAIFASFPDGVWEDANGWYHLSSSPAAIL